MRFLAWIISAVNIYFGIYFFLNVIHVLQSSKYSQTADLVFAILFSGLGAAGIYMILVKHNLKLALLAGAGPWVLALLFLFINMITGDYK